MNIQFSVAGTPLDSSEALALLNVAAKAGTNSNTIELTDLIDVSSLDANQLFQTAVATENSTLASLAWKISVGKWKQPTTGSGANGNESKPAPKLSIVKPRGFEKDLGSIIEHLNKSSSYSSLGAAIILQQAASVEWSTIRETAIKFVNTMWRAKPETRGCKMYRGFSLVNGELTPIDFNSGVERKQTFHVSPAYIALREGLLFCTNNGLVQTKRAISIGNYMETKQRNTEQMRRIYYRFKATQRGQDLIEMWADMDRYIDKGFASQLAS